MEKGGSKGETGSGRLADHGRSLWLGAGQLQLTRPPAAAWGWRGVTSGLHARVGLECNRLGATFEILETPATGAVGTA